MDEVLEKIIDITKKYKTKKDGVIQRFEFTYELAWRTTKEYLQNIGITEVNSPKAVIKEVYAQKIITNEQN